jgi:hypothetical protein
MTTIEGNKLIAEFMGASENHRGWISIPHRGWGYQKKHYPGQLKYHKDWQWLMPVIEKIESLSASIYWAFSVEIRKNFCAVYCHEKGKMDGMIYQTPYGTNPESKIVAVWDAVIDFIQWYNKQK